MSYGLPVRAGNPCAGRIAHLPAKLLLTTLPCALFFSACSGNSVAPSAAPVATPAAETLSIAASLPPASVNSSYSGSVSATGGTAPYIFSVSSGQLPSGVLLADSSGAVSGTPSAAGNFTFTVSALDAKGFSQQKSLQIAVTDATSNSGSGSSGASGSGSGSSGNGPNSSASNNMPSFSNLQRAGGWGQYAQTGPKYIDCSPSPCEGVTFSMAQNVTSPSLSGQASEFSISGDVPFGDALWNNHLIGPGSSQGLPDSNQTTVPSLHDFVYDVYFYGSDLGTAQALEFDINQFFDNNGFIWGHECRIGAGNEWDIWDNQNQDWKPTGIPCYPNNNSWNHLTIKVQRNSNDELVYQSITLNGNTGNLGWTFPHGSAPGWYGVTVNYQMDLNNKQSAYKVYLDNLTFSYQ